MSRLKDVNACSIHKNSGVEQNVVCETETMINQFVLPHDIILHSFAFLFFVVVYSVAVGAQDNTLVRFCFSFFKLPLADQLADYSLFGSSVCMVKVQCRYMTKPTVGTD